jgi:hypothetical protein
VPRVEDPERLFVLMLSDPPNEVDLVQSSALSSQLSAFSFQLSAFSFQLSAFSYGFTS